MIPRIPDEPAYSLLLGYWLGDGHSAQMERTVALIDRHPRPFLRGLLMSDGCRCLNSFSVTLPSGRVAEYTYVRYFFSNLSTDIRLLFCEYCDRLGIGWTQSNPRNISVAHRQSVALLDEFVGPKR